MEDDRDGYYVADRDGNCTRMPPPGLSASQRLRWANERCTPTRKRPPQVTEAEIGMSFVALRKLDPRRRLEIINAAFARREKH
jgi:hypothetical protein